MKKLYIVRHAKSSWDESGVSDHDRKLSERGNRDAPRMGKLFQKLGYKPEVIYSSSANRALTTARIIAKKIDYPLEDIIITHKIYDAMTSDLIKLINTMDDKFSSLMLFGHNPSFTVLSNLLSDKYIDNIPTCGATVIQLNVKSWKEVESDCGSLIAFEYPKKHQ